MKLNKFTYFYPEKPKLINVDQQLFEELSNNPEWIAELKYNESRLQLHFINRGFQFWNRHGEEFNYTPEEVVFALHGLTLFETGFWPQKRNPQMDYWLFDGGLRHNKTKGIRHQIILYDIFIMDGELLVDKPFWYRRSILEKLARDDDKLTISIPEQFSSDFRAVYDCHIKRPEIEGLVMKKLSGKLRLGRKTGLDSDWMFKARRPNNSYRF